MLAELLAATRVDGALLVPLGLATLIVVAGLLTAWSTTAPLAWPAVTLLAVAGLIAGLRTKRLRRPGPWPIVLAAGTFLVYALPVLLTGKATIGGYIKLDDTASWLNITDHVMQHGRSLAGLAPSSYSANLNFYLSQTGYPIGSFLPLGVGHALTGQDSAWLFQPYESFLGAALALALYALMEPIAPRPPVRAAVAFVAAQPALLFGYAMWGGVKEIAAAVLLPLIAVLVVRLVRAGARPGEALLAAIACGALAGVLGLGAGPWLAGSLLGGLIAMVRARRGARAGGVFAVAALVFSLPALVLVKAFIKGGLPTFTGDGFSSKYANLFHPLSPLQLLGVWPSGDFRITPDPAWPLVPFVALLLAAIAFGVLLLWRLRAWALVAYPAGALLACVIIGAVAQPWLVAKAFATAAPAVLLLALAGAIALVSRFRRPVALIAGGLMAAGVLWSNALAYTQTTPAPAERFAELERLGHRIAGQGPTLVAEPEIYADRHFLRDADPEGAGDLRVRLIALQNGGSLLNGSWADLDAFSPAAFVPYKTVVVRRNPVQSRPPYPYRRIWQGEWYEAWQRPRANDDAGLIEHDGLGDNVRRPFCGRGAERFLGRCGVVPAAVPRCAQVKRLAAVARQRHGYLLAAPRENPVVVEPDALRRPASWGWDPFRGWLSPRAPGAATATLFVPRTGRYEAWLGGSFSRAITPSLDGRGLKRAEWQPSNFGGYVRVGPVDLSRGAHTLALRTGSPGLHPGSAESRPDFNRIGPFVLAPEGGADRPVLRVGAGQATSLCGRSLDWMEVVTGA